MTETVAEILDAYRAGAVTPADMVARCYARIRAHNDPAMFIALRDEKDVTEEAQALEGSFLTFVRDSIGIVLVA